MAIAIYARKSIERENSVSCEAQTAYCKAMLRPEEKEEEILIFTDNGKSGANMVREAFQEMMRGVEKGEIRKIIVYRLDRISRSLSDFVKILEMLKKYQVQFVSSQETFDTSGPYGEMIVKILMIFAEFERQSIVERITQAYAYRSEKGFFMGGRAPFGFVLTDAVIDGVPTKKLRKKDEEMDTVRYLFSRYATGNVTLRALSGEVEGISAAKISAILKNPIYVRADNDIYEYYRKRRVKMIGEISDFDGTRGVQFYGNTNRSCDFCEKKAVLMHHEGVISSQIFLACQEKLVKNKRFGAACENTTSMFGGLVICGTCGKTMTAVKGGKRRDGTQTRYFYCKDQKTHTENVRTIYVSCLEKAVFPLVEEKLASLKDHGMVIFENDERENSLKNRISEIEKEEEKLVLLTLSDALEAEMLFLINEKARFLAEEKSAFQSEIIKLRQKREKEPTVNFVQAWREADEAQKKAVCHLLIQKIMIRDDGTAEIFWYI